MHKGDAVFGGLVLFAVAGLVITLVLTSPEPPDKNSMYYQDCRLLNQKYGGGVSGCIEYMTVNPNATGRDVVNELTTSPAEKLLDKQLGQSHNNAENIP